MSSARRQPPTIPVNTFYQLLDRAPKGRDEDDIRAGQWWWRRHDEYEDGERS